MNQQIMLILTAIMMKISISGACLSESNPISSECIPKHNEADYCLRKVTTLMDNAERYVNEGRIDRANSNIKEYDQIDCKEDITSWERCCVKNGGNGCTNVELSNLHSRIFTVNKLREAYNEKARKHNEENKLRKF